MYILSGLRLTQAMLATRPNHAAAAHSATHTHTTRRRDRPHRDKQKMHAT